MRRSRPAVFSIALISLTALVGLAACSSDDSTTDTPVANGGDKPTIKLAENAWTASSVNVAIAKLLIEQNLGNNVEIVKIDENAQFAGLAAGDLDATLEIWPSGVVAEEQKYIDDGQVANDGPLGAIGKIGWFVPDYVQTEYPTLTSWEGFKDPAVAKAFATAETGDKGRFLGTDPSYSQYDEAIVKTLGLPLQVQFSGSEAATVAELDSRVAAKEPIVMYWWTPTAAVAKYNLKPVALPAYTKDCYADPAKIACDYPEDILFKASSAKLATKDPAVSAFLKKFTISNEDQLGMLPAVEIDKTPVEEVAAKWIADHESVWKAWLS